MTDFAKEARDLVRCVPAYTAVSERLAERAEALARRMHAAGVAEGLVTAAARGSLWRPIADYRLGVDVLIVCGDEVSKHYGMASLPPNARAWQPLPAPPAREPPQTAVDKARETS